MLVIGQKIQEYRVKNELSQEMLAEKLGVSRQSVSKWELGQTLPEVDKIIAMSKLFSVAADELLAICESSHYIANKNKLHFGMYLIVEDFKKSLDFYESLLSIRAEIITPNIFAQFFIDGINMSIMHVSNLKNHNTNYSGDNKFTLNFWVNDLKLEYERIKKLDIGRTTEILKIHKNYHYFNLYDPDNNVIEITGNYIINVE